MRKYFTQISILLICCSIISRQPDQPVFFCPLFCFSRIQSSLKCISFMTHFTLMEIKLTTFWSNSVYLERGLCFMNWLGTHMTPMQCRVLCDFSCGRLAWQKRNPLDQKSLTRRKFFVYCFFPPKSALIACRARNSKCQAYTLSSVCLSACCLDQGNLDSPGNECFWGKNLFCLWVKIKQIFANKTCKAGKMWYSYQVSCPCIKPVLRISTLKFIS